VQSRKLRRERRGELTRECGYECLGEQVLVTGNVVGTDVNGWR